MATKTCKRCNSSIPDNKNYCIHHYMEELHKYEGAMSEYRVGLAKWNMLSPAERVRLDSLAEADKVKEFAIYFGLVMGLGVWFLIYMAIGIDWKYGILITISTASILVFIKPLQILLGKSARCLAMGVMYFAVAGFIAWLLSMFIPKIQENVQPVTIALAVVACIISLYREATGMHHASAIPREPSKPTP